MAPLADQLVQLGLLSYHVGPWEDGSWSARFATGEWFPEPDSGIAAMLTAIESLDELARSIWAVCTSRDFNIGYDCGDEPWAFTQQLLPATLARMGAVGASLVITIYPILETEAVEAAISILRKDTWIKRRIGKRAGSSISYTDSSALKKNQAYAKVTLHGKKGSVFVHCLMELTMEGDWGIKEILKRELRLSPITPPPEGIAGF